MEGCDLILQACKFNERLDNVICAVRYGYDSCCLPISCLLHPMDWLSSGAYVSFRACNVCRLAVTAEHEEADLRVAFEALKSAAKIALK